jgi:hypothetical protein
MRTSDCNRRGVLRSAGIPEGDGGLRKHGRPLHKHSEVLNVTVDWPGHGRPPTHSRTPKALPIPAKAGLSSHIYVVYIHKAAICNSNRTSREDLSSMHAHTGHPSRALPTACTSTMHPSRARTRHHWLAGAARAIVRVQAERHTHNRRHRSFCTTHRGRKKQHAPIVDHIGQNASHHRTLQARQHRHMA